MIDIESMEEAIISKLKEISELRYVDSYQGDIEDIGAKGTIPMPAALTVYGGAEPEQEINIDSVKAKIKIRISVFVAGKNLRGKKEASQDVRAMLKKAREKLNGLRYEKRILLWQGESLAAMTPIGICIYEQLYEYTDYLIQ